LAPLPPRPKPIEQWDEEETAADALARIGSPAVPSLVQAMQNPDPQIRLKAVKVLGRMGPDAKDAVPDLIRLLEDPDEEIRKAASRTLGRIGPAAQEAVPALMRTLFQANATPADPAAKNPAVGAQEVSGATTESPPPPTVLH
jgi:hypothetical protein